MLAAEVWDLHTRFGLLEDGHDLALGESGFPHVESHMLTRVQNSTHHLDHFSGGLPSLNNSKLFFIPPDRHMDQNPAYDRFD
jgi:hypothetical protein